MIFLFGILLFSAVILFFLVGTKSKSSQAPQNKFGTSKKKLPCILCSSVLGKGENLKSEKYTIGEDIFVHTFGCPYCYGTKKTRERICPVCKRQLKDDEYLLGTMWKQKSGKLHLHVSGCCKCAENLFKMQSRKSRNQ